MPFARLHPLALVAVLAVAALPALARAQATPDVTGKWKVAYVAGRTIENGEETVHTDTTVLTVTAQGDSVVATFPGGRRPDGSVAMVTLRGTRTPQGATLSMTRKIRINENGNETTPEVVITWVLRVDGNALSGESTMTGMPNGPPMGGPLTGTRVAGA